jgi:hypothetical protein
MRPGKSGLLPLDEQRGAVEELLTGLWPHPLFPSGQPTDLALAYLRHEHAVPGAVYVRAVLDAHTSHARTLHTHTRTHAHYTYTHTHAHTHTTHTLHTHTRTLHTHKPRTHTTHTRRVGAGGRVFGRGPAAVQGCAGTTGG